MPLQNLDGYSIVVGQITGLAILQRYFVRLIVCKDYQLSPLAVQK